MPNGREVTIYDIARKLKISTATVSRALKDDPVVSKKTRRIVREQAEQMGYRSNLFARNLRQKQTHTIGVLVHELRSTFITSVVAGIEKVATAAGYDLIIAHSAESRVREAAGAHNLFHKRVDGLIASLAFDTKDLEHFRPFKDKGIPVVFFDRVEPDAGYPTVVIDNYKGGYAATAHLAEQGCRRIAHVTSNLNRNVYAQRFRGYRDALRDHGLAYDEELLVLGDLDEEAGVESALRLLECAQRPDGIFFTNDFVAAVSMRTLRSKGIRIPEDMAVVGFNNDAISKLIEPALTTVNYPGQDMGEIAALHLVNHLKGQGDLAQTNTIIVRSELIVRESSLRRPAGR